MSLSVAPIQERESDRQPVQQPMGGAHLFRSDTVANRSARWRARLLTSTRLTAGTFAAALALPPDQAGLAATIAPASSTSSRGRAVEDFRIDFEDGLWRQADTKKMAMRQSVAGKKSPPATRRALHCRRSRHPHQANVDRGCTRAACERLIFCDDPRARKRGRLPPISGDDPKISWGPGHVVAVARSAQRSSGG